MSFVLLGASVASGMGAVLASLYLRECPHPPRGRAASPAVSVTCWMSCSTAVLEVRNHGCSPVLDVELLDIHRVNGHPHESWQAAFRVPPIPTFRELLPSGFYTRSHIWLLDPHGQRLTQLPETTQLHYRVRYRDTHDQQWLLQEHTPQPTPAD